MPVGGEGGVTSPSVGTLFPRFRHVTSVDIPTCRTPCASPSSWSLIWLPVAKIATSTTFTAAREPVTFPSESMYVNASESTPTAISSV